MWQEDLKQEKIEMKKELRVWGGPKNEHGDQVRVVVAAASEAKAIKALGISYYQFKTYFGVTANEGEQEVARACPEQVFISKD